MNPYVRLARTTIEEYVKNKRILELPKGLPDELTKNRAGVFVTIHKKNVQPDEEPLRGCIGTITPTKDNIAQEIIDNAIAAATHDDRFMPVTTKELANLEISVDILGEPELIKNISELEAKKYGVIVKSKDGRTGLLLPDIEGVDSPEQQISISRQKAGISPDEPIDLYRFKVKRYEE